MDRVPWLIDSKMFAKKIKHSIEATNWMNDVSIFCPRCNYKIDNSYVQQDWPGLPFGVKFEPTDQELVKHLQAKSGIGNERLHPFIDDFISTLDGVNGICYTHPEKLPGIKKDGSSIHFFHKTMKAYATGTRKRRKIQDDNDPCGEDLRWHKTGKTRPVIDNGEQIGCKKIMVLYVNPGKGLKSEKTNWVMHQYHLGTEEDEKDNEYVISKIYYQQAAKQEEAGTSKGGPLTPSSITPPRAVRSHICLEDEKDMLDDNQLIYEQVQLSPVKEKLVAVAEKGKLILNSQLPDSGQYVDPPFQTKEETKEENLDPPSNFQPPDASEKNPQFVCGQEADCFNESFFQDMGFDSQFFGDSQFLADSQELVKKTLLCAEIFKDQLKEEPKEGSIAPLPELKELNVAKGAPSLENIYVDSLPSDIQLSESQFSSQESLTGWIKKNLNFPESESQVDMAEKNLEDSQYM